VTCVCLEPRQLLVTDSPDHLLRSGASSRVGAQSGTIWQCFRLQWSTLQMLLRCTGKGRSGLLNMLGDARFIRAWECVLDETTKGGDSDSYSGETATYHLTIVCWSHLYSWPENGDAKSMKRNKPLQFMKLLVLYTSMWERTSNRENRREQA